MSAAHCRRYGEGRRTLFRQLRNRRGTAQVQGDNGAAEGNRGSIDTNFTNSHGLIQGDSIKVVRFVPIRVSNPNRRLVLPVRLAGCLVVRERGVARGWLPFVLCKLP